MYVNNLLCMSLHSSVNSNRLHGRVVKGMGHLGHDEAMEVGGREFSLHGRVVKGAGHLGHDEAMEVGGREFDPRPGHYSIHDFLVQPGNWYGFLI